jgi:queuine tRNA-ribosyltransferase
MAVGTAATVKALTPDQVRRTGTEVVLCNTYHLAVRPGEEVIAAAGGLHRFMGWDGPILTDSGGFQVFSLATARSVDENGVTFRNHVDGAEMRLTPERAMEIQQALRSDIAMVLDECLPFPCDDETARRSLEERTLPWEIRSLACHPRDGRAVFAIGQGGFSEAVRASCLAELMRHPFDGFAIGGLAVGESREVFLRMVEVSTALLPWDKPRYLMGVGSPRELLDAIALGVDLFDCVLPTRNARNGQALTASGPIRLRNAAHAKDFRPLEEGCPCEACGPGLSRAYLRHLFVANEMLAGTLVTSHNLTFLQRLMACARAAIAEGRFAEWRGGFGALSSPDPG